MKLKNRSWQGSSWWPETIRWPMPSNMILLVTFYEDDMLAFLLRSLNILWSYSIILVQWERIIVVLDYCHRTVFFRSLEISTLYAFSDVLRPILNPFSHGVGHIGHALLWRQIAKQNVKYQNFEKLCIPWKLSCEYFFSEGVPLKNIILCLLS
jgi:hypothetical protein